jgi:hypothetical protein
MGLPWVRLDSNAATHDKFLALIADPSPKRWQAISSYFFALGWSGGQGTDGFVYAYALSVVHGTPQTARLLVKYALWDEGTNGWQIRNYDLRQELEVVSEAKRAAQSLGGKKARCRENHGPDCGCWKRSA